MAWVTTNSQSKNHIYNWEAVVEEALYFMVKDYWFLEKWKFSESALNLASTGTH